MAKTHAASFTNLVGNHIAKVKLWERNKKKKLPFKNNTIMLRNLFENYGFEMADLNIKVF